MRIVLVSQYYFPETGATSNRVHSLAKKFVKEGHEVTVIAEKPNHPAGKFFPGYENGFFHDGVYDGIPVLYTWVYTRPQKNFIKRILFYLSFMLTSTLAAFKIKGKADVVLASSPPLFVGLAGYMISTIKRAKFVFDVRDLWPDLAVAMGELNNPMIIKWAKKLEHFIYHRAEGITAATDGFCREIADVVGQNKPLKRVMNGTVPEIFNINGKRDALRRKEGMEGHFVVMYAGNIGICQGLDHIIEAAEELNRSLPQVRIQFVGDGPVEDKLARLAKQKKLSNVYFKPRMSMNEAAEYMSASDALLVPLANKDIYKMFIPSKLFDSMAAGRPVLLSVDGEARSILEEARAGLFYPPENGNQLAEKIKWLHDHPEERAEMGRRGIEYAQEHCTRDVQAKKMLNFLEQIVRDEHE